MVQRRRRSWSAGLLLVSVACTRASSAPAPAADAALEAGADADASIDPRSLAGLALWLRADAIASGPVVDWSDDSGRAVSVTAAPPCTPAALAAGAQNGLAAVVLDGVTSCFALGAGFDDFTAGLTLYVVARADAGDGALLDLAIDSATGRIAVARAAGRLDFTATDVTGASLGTASVADAPDLGWHLYEVRHPALIGTPTHVTRDRVVGDPFAMVHPPVAMRARNAIGRGPASGGGETHLAGAIGEILLYTRALKASELLAVERYLRAKWGLP